MQPAIQIVSIGLGGVKLLAKLETYASNVQCLAIDIDPAALAIARQLGAANIQLHANDARLPGPEALQRAVLERAQELRALAHSIQVTLLVANLAEPIASAIAPCVASLYRETGSSVHAIVVVPHAVLTRKTAQRAGIALNQLTACTDSVSMPQPSNRHEDLTVREYLDQLDSIQLQQIRDAISALGA